ncbi:unnamed protein product, partial [Amoebophrya sp. A25]
DFRGILNGDRQQRERSTPPPQYDVRGLLALSYPDELVDTQAEKIHRGGSELPPNTMREQMASKSERASRHHKRRQAGPRKQGTEGGQREEERQEEAGRLEAGQEETGVAALADDGAR